MRTRLPLLVTLAFALLALTSCGMPGAPNLGEPLDAPVGAYGVLVENPDDRVQAGQLDGATVLGVVRIRIDASDEVVSIEYRVGSSFNSSEVAVTTSTVPFSMTLDTTSFPDADYSLTAVINRKDGGPLRVTADFTIANDAATPGRDWDLWLSTDVGVVGLEGEARIETDADSVILRASGSDVWNEEDSFHYKYQELTGNGTLTVRIDSIDAVDEWTKVGVMIRETLAPDARNAFILLTENRGAVFQGRPETGARTTDTHPDGHLMATPEPTAPWWLQIERQGDTLTGSHSPDGETWTELGHLTIHLPHDTLIGMAVTSRTNEAIATGIFSNVNLQRIEQPNDDSDNEDDTHDSDTSLPPVPITGPTVSASYSGTNAIFPNPERGWHGYGANTDSYARQAAEGFTLVQRTVRLDDYRHQALPASLLDDLRRDLATLREHGLKVILRFAYNHGYAADAPRERVLQHIEQLTPILQEHTDVIAALQAGFIGAWGEWHASTHDLLTLDNRTAITNALLNAMHESRMIQIRYPHRTRDMFPTPPTAATAFNGSNTSRVAQLNDCFVSTDSDGGTYLSPEDYTYAQAVTPYTIMGGETCQIAGVNSRNDGNVAVEELARYHYDYLNHNFYAPIIDKWRAQGYYDEISRRLGYRYVMHETTSQATAQPGNTYSLNIRIENQGFGKLYNPRPINIILQPTSGDAPITLRANDDARHVLPLAGETHTITLTTRLPTTLPTGTYNVYLHLPDAATTLANDPRYAIRFANQHTWNDTNAHNNLNIQLTIND